MVWKAHICLTNIQFTQIYKSSWIHRHETFKIISTPTLPVDSIVSSLIEKDNRWKDEKIRQHFRLEDPKMILKVPLPRTPRVDQIIWHYDKLENYLVKSGSQKLWNVIWKLDLPKTLKFFMWRASKNFLLTVVKLWKKEKISQICRGQEESVNHALFSCKKSNKIWRRTPFGKDAYTLASQDLLSGL